MVSKKLPHNGLVILGRFLSNTHRELPLSNIIELNMTINTKNDITVSHAYNLFFEKDYQTSLHIFEILNNNIGNNCFNYNITQCKKNILTNKISNSPSTEYDILINKSNNVNHYTKPCSQNNYINIVYVLDVKFIIPTFVSIYSLIKNKLTTSLYNIYVLTNFNDYRIFNLFNSFNSETTIINVIYSKQDLSFHTCKYDRQYLTATPTALYKFYISEILLDINKVIYIDGDTIIRKDLSNLFNINIENYVLAAVRDYPQVLFNEQIFSINSDYFNTGVLLLNLSKFRKENYTNKLIYAKTKLHNDNLMDQNVFNTVLKNKVLLLDIKYNMPILNMYRSKDKYSISDLNNTLNTTYKNIDEIIKKSYIIHYSSKHKPWKYYDTPGNILWMKYFRQTELFHKLNFKRLSKNDTENNYTDIDIKNKKHQAICFCLNNNYIDNLIVAIKSLIYNLSYDYCYDIYILHTDITEDNINKVIKLKQIDIDIKFIQISNLIRGIKLISRAHYSKEMHYRIFIPRIFLNYDKVLYLDSDLIICKDISDIFSIDLHDNLIAAVRNLYTKHMKDHIINDIMINENQYFNSGVILFNTKQSFCFSIEDKFFNALNTLKSLPCPDQDALNFICKNKVFYLPECFNFQTHFLFLHKEMAAKDRDVIKNYAKSAKIIHFTSGKKPWNFNEHPYFQDYQFYLQLKVN